MKKSLLLIICLLVSCFAYSQGVITGPKKRTQTTTSSSSSSKPTKRTQTTSSSNSSRRTQTTSSNSSSRPVASSQTSSTIRASKTQISNGIRYTVGGVSFDMVDVDGGSFQMGADDSDAYDDEKPVHREYVSTFRIGKTEVTQALWKAVMDSNPSRFVGDNLPVGDVSWDDCKTFISKLNSITGENFRLPTEAEWEYAARGGNKSHGYKYSGSNSIGQVAWYADNSGSTPHPVATKSPNELGIYDMTGNEWEWTSDLWCSNYNSNRDGSRRAYRGGGWYYNARCCRVSYRGYCGPSNSLRYIGFRLALSTEDTSNLSDSSSATSIQQNHVVSQATSTPIIPSSSPVNPNTYSINGVIFEMVTVEGGSFQMGADDSDAYDYEKPVHSEYVSTFRIGKTEVTQALWKAVMGSNPSNFKGDNLPVESVSWNACKTFISKLNSITGENFRLPTEAEWEYAARGGNKSRGYKYSGSNSIGDVAWYDGNSGNKTHPVAMKSPNELGIYDMSGNVYEWTSDISGSYSSSIRDDSYRMNRGGSWYDIARRCRVSYRVGNGPSGAGTDDGFRLAL